LVIPRESLPGISPHEQPDRAFECYSVWADIQTVSCLISIVTACDSLLPRLPEIHKELQNLLRNTEDSIRKLPKPPSSDPFGEVLNLIGNFSRDLSRHLEGTPEKGGLLQTIRPAQLRFRRTIRATAPIFRPYKMDCTHAETPTLPKFLACEETEEEELDSEDSGDFHPGNPVYIDEVFERAQEYVKFLLL
jgi:hypothetical protein